VTPSDPLVKAANAALADPNFRASVRQMHAEGYPLEKMVDALGLEDDMTTRIRQILAELPPEVVADIRQAILAMLDRDEHVMPLDCGLSGIELENGTPIDVDINSDSGKPTIRVRSRASV